MVTPKAMLTLATADLPHVRGSAHGQGCLLPPRAACPPCVLARVNKRLAHTSTDKLRHDLAMPQSFSLRRLMFAAVQTTTLLGFAALMIGNLTLTLYFDQQRARTLEAVRVNARNLSTAYEQHIVRAIKNIDQALLFARAEFARDPAAFSLETIASRDYFPSDLALQIAMIGPDGMVRGSNLLNNDPVDLSDREHFRVHIDNTADELFISKPVLGRVSKLWTVQFTRKMLNPDGTFAGVIVASLNPYYLARLYDSIDIGRLGAVTLWGPDGIIRARGGMSADVVGRSIADPGMVKATLQKDAGLYEGPSVIDGIARIVSLRKVADYPLVLAVSFGRDEVLQDFEAAKKALQQIIILVDLALFAIMALGVLEKYRLNRTRDELDAKAQALSSTLANTHEGILMADANGDVVTINERALALLGLTDAIDLPVPFARLPVARWHASTLECLDALDAPQAQECVLETGQVIEIRTSTMPGGGFVKTLNDITQRKADQHALEDARDKAEAASRARTAFLATMSHEIRTPLGGIVSMVDLIGTTPLDATQRRYLNITRDSAEHLLQLINDILDVTKLDADQVTVENIRFDLHRQIRSTLDIVSAKALEKGLFIGCLMAPDVPRDILGDPGRLRQILLNLLGNAIKFTARGHVLLAVSRRRDVAAGDRLVVRVEDTGIGIAPEKVADLFRDFSQLDTSISRRFGGSGLGLAISRKLLTRMGGTIGVAGAPDGGSQFFFELPLNPVSEPEPLVRDPGAIAIASTNRIERELVCRQISPGFDNVEAFGSLEHACAWLRELQGEGRRILLVDTSLAPERGMTRFIQARNGGPAIAAYLLCTRQAQLASDRASEMAYTGIVRKPVFIDTFMANLAGQSASGEDLVASTQHSPLKDRLPGLDVLLAEDNTTNQFALRRILETMGARVTAVSNGREALDRATHHRFDIVLMDVMMPELDGLTATRAIRALPEPFDSVPIVALTANAFLEDRDAALASGMNGFATKPITGQRLLDAIEACQAMPGRPVASTPTQAGLAAISALDRSTLDQLREDLGAEHLETATDLFLRDVVKRADVLRKVGVDVATLRREAHALRGSAASFGFLRLAEAAAKLENAVRAQETDRFVALLALLLNEADQAPDHLKTD